jgi:hypothetical protein
MNLDDVMQALADRLDTITGLRVHAHPPDKITPPAAVVTYPDRVDYDQTYARGMDRLELPVVVLVGKVSARASRDDLARFVDGSGAASVKAVIESGTYTAFDTVRVTEAVFDIVSMAGVEYLSATFTCDITGSGA